MLCGIERSEPAFLSWISTDSSKSGFLAQPNRLKTVVNSPWLVRDLLAAYWVLILSDNYTLRTLCAMCFPFDSEILHTSSGGSSITLPSRQT